jgi:hypothetical protein
LNTTDRPWMDAVTRSASAACLGPEDPITRKQSPAIAYDPSSSNAPHPKTMGVGDTNFAVKAYQGSNAPLHIILTR